MWDFPVIFPFNQSIEYQVGMNQNYFEAEERAPACQEEKTSVLVLYIHMLR